MEEQKYNSISKEALQAVLQKAGVFKGWEKEPANDIPRIAYCEALGMEFEIEWWINLCYLRIGHMQMGFHYVRVDTTWPWHEYRTELHFENSIRRPLEPADTVAVLGIEYRQDYLEEHPELAPIWNTFLKRAAERARAEGHEFSEIIRCSECKYQCKKFIKDKRRKDGGYWFCTCDKIGDNSSGFGGFDREFCSSAERKGDRKCGGQKTSKEN